MYQLYTHGDVTAGTSDNQVIKVKDRMPLLGFTGKPIKHDQLQKTAFLREIGSRYYLDFPTEDYRYRSYTIDNFKMNSHRYFCIFTVYKLNDHQKVDDMNFLISNADGGEDDFHYKGICFLADKKTLRILAQARLEIRTILIEIIGSMKIHVRQINSMFCV